VSLHAPSLKITTERVLVPAPYIIVSQERVKDFCWLAISVSLICVTLTDAHLTWIVKSTFTFPGFETVTFTETVWPIVAEPVGEIVTELIVGVGAAETCETKLAV